MKALKVHYLRAMCRKIFQSSKTFNEQKLVLGYKSFYSNFTKSRVANCNDIGLKGDRPWKDLWVNDNTTSSYNYHRGYCELRIWIEYLFNGFKYMIVYVMSSWSWFWKVTDPGIVESGECPLPKNSQFLWYFLTFLWYLPVLEASFREGFKSPESIR